MSSLNSIEQLERKRESFNKLKLFLFQHLVECFTLDKLDRDKFVLFCLDEFIDRCDIRVVESGTCLCLAHQPLLHRLIGRSGGRNKLQRNSSAQRSIEGLVHNTHPAFAQLLKNSIVRNSCTNHSHHSRGFEVETGRCRQMAT